MRTKRSIQINVCVSPAEMRRARATAKRETEGNVSALVRKRLFGVANAVIVTPVEESNDEAFAMPITSEMVEELEAMMSTQTSEETQEVHCE